MIRPELKTPVPCTGDSLILWPWAGRRSGRSSAAVGAEGHLAAAQLGAPGGALLSLLTQNQLEVMLQPLDAGQAVGVRPEIL